MKTKHRIFSICILLQFLFFGSDLYSQFDENIKTKLDGYLSVQKERINFKIAPKMVSGYHIHPNARMSM